MTNTDTWRQRVAEWRASGLTAPEFCAREGIDVGTLRYWAYRGLAKSGGDTPSSPDVRVARVICEPRSAPSPSGASIVVDTGRVKVDVHPGFDQATLAALLDVLERRTSAGVAR